MFDDLFEKFFGKNRRKEEPKNNKEQENSDKVDGFFRDLLSSLPNPEYLENQFGKPEKVEYFEEDGLYYKKETWSQENGSKMTHIVGSSKPFTKELTYEEQLKIALSNEDYETASILRDKINEINNK